MVWIASVVCAMERDMTRIMSCPGVVMTTSEATMNSNQEASSMWNLAQAQSNRITPWAERPVSRT